MMIFLYYTQNEFKDRVLVDGKIIYTNIEEINSSYNKTGYHAIDGSA